MWILFGVDSGGGSDIGNWSSILSSLTNIGFAIGVGWYLLTKALPSMQERFEKALAEQRAVYTTRDAERRIEFKHALDAVIAHCEREGHRHSEEHRQVTAEAGEALKDNRFVMEEVRDSLRAVREVLIEANQLLLRKRQYRVVTQDDMRNTPPQPPR